jgi:predicted lipid-binding transport protein (Tim44 family)
VNDELERPPSLWPWIIGGLLLLFVIGAVIGSIVRAVSELLIIVAVIALIVWAVMRLVGGNKR